MGKVIDLTSRLKSVNPVSEQFNFSSPSAFGAETISSTPAVVNYAEQKQRLLFHERRQAKRTVLSEFVSAMCVIPEKGLLKVSLYDISEEGISFDLEVDQGQFQIDEIVSMRVYLNHKTYFPLSVQVKHVTLEPTEGVTRHGTVFLRGAAVDSQTDAALQYFVRFIETAGAGLKKDDGDLMAPKTS